jgi:hypothetical protein
MSDADVPDRRRAQDRITEVLVVGDANPDLVLTGDLVPRFGQAEQDVEAAVTLGGSGAIAAAALARLGVGVAIAAAVGDDDLGRLIEAKLGERGVATEALALRPSDRPVRPLPARRRPGDPHERGRDRRPGRRLGVRGDRARRAPRPSELGLPRAAAARGRAPRARRRARRRRDRLGHGRRSAPDSAQTYGRIH